MEKGSGSVDDLDIGAATQPLEFPASAIDSVSTDVEKGPAEVVADQEKGNTDEAQGELVSIILSQTSFRLHTLH